MSPEGSPATIQIRDASALMPLLGFLVALTLPEPGRRYARA